jgi:hypothetical protein
MHHASVSGLLQPVPVGRAGSSYRHGQDNGVLDQGGRATANNLQSCPVTVPPDV